MSKPAALSRLPSSVIPVPSLFLSPFSQFALAGFPLITAPFHPSRRVSVYASTKSTPRHAFGRNRVVPLALPRRFIKYVIAEPNCSQDPRHDRDNQRTFCVFFPVAESLVQELELERKSRQHQAAERDQVKSPLQGGFNDASTPLNLEQTRAPVT